ncbi:TIGR01777 family protein [Bowdeniella nasicola]|uniref:TIGR01777 family protein n=1 Tax=Bowdeniella nasicola TaxID=208480 RepID=A0A1Q5Q5B2_9ACTO|nr:TIGR01777 family oxidoreductase [Bowdeniella nasicola]OKL54892.1 TIGR01777 family protein [Bowdeniella nasicola]
MARLIIAGASGFLGTALTALAHERGWDVTHLVRRAPRSAREILWDPAAGKLHAPQLAGADAIVCLSGAGIADRPWTPGRQREIIASRIETVTLLADAIAQLPEADRPRVFASASAVGFYGSRGNQILTEDSPAGHGWLAEVCRAWEAAALPVADLGVRTLQLRTGHLMDRADGLLGVLLPLYRYRLGAKLGDGHQYFPSIWIKDHAAATLFALEHDSLSGPLNVVGPEPVPFEVWHETLQDLLGRSSPLPLPTAALRAMGAMGEELLLASQRVVPEKLTDAGFVFEAPTVRDILAAAIAGPYAT